MKSETGESQDSQFLWRVFERPVVIVCVVVNFVGNASEPRVLVVEMQQKEQVTQKIIVKSIYKIPGSRAVL